MKISTQSVSEALSLQSAMRERMVGQHTGGAAFAWSAIQVSVGDLLVSSSSYAGSVRGVAEDVNRYWLSVTLASGGIASQRGVPAMYRPGLGCILSPGSGPVDTRLDDGFRGHLVGISVPVIQRTLAAMHGAEVGTPASTVTAPRFQLAVDYRHGVATGIARLVEFLLAEGQAEHSVLAVPAIAARMEESFVLAMLQLPHDRLPEKARDVGIEAVRRVEETIAANAASPITLTDLAELAGTSIRVLQSLFRRHRGYTPMAFLRARRFEIARARLASGEAATIAAIAMDCGFTHLGRFSTEYRARFGERPSETRRRATWS